MSTIPSKQLHRIGTTQQLQEKLIDREIGYSITDYTAYIKIDGALYPIGGGTSNIPLPSKTSVFIGRPDGTYVWDASGLDSTKDMWVSLDGHGLFANQARNDSEGRFLASSSYVFPGADTVYGALTVEKVGDTSKVKIRKGNQTGSGAYVDLGSLVPLADSSMAGDVLSVGVDGSTGWMHPDVDVTQGSNKLVTSGAVYTAVGGAAATVKAHTDEKVADEERARKEVDAALASRIQELTDMIQALSNHIGFNIFNGN